VLIFSMQQAYVINENGSSNINMTAGNNMTAGDNMTAIETFKEKTMDDRLTLKVALFPHIPDSGGDGYKGLQQYIKNEFEKQFPNFNLELRQINPNEDHFYNVTTLINWLTDTINGYDIVEIDTVVLGDLVNAGVIVPQRLSSTSEKWHPAAVTAVQFNQAYYAFPHLLCAFFLLTYSPEVSQAKTIDQLVTSLGILPSGSQRIVGNLNSSWELPALWIDSFRDTYTEPSYTEAEALHDYDDFRFESLRKLARLCDILGQPNRCLNGAFRDADGMTDLFIRGQATAMFGYSERLFRIIKNGFPGALNYVKVSPLPLGTNRNEPVFFTDAFVLRRHMSGNLRIVADVFVQFMGTPHMQAVLVGSGDNPSPARVPRYLLPVVKSAYDHPLLSSDPIYQQVFRNLNGTCYPTAGFYSARKALQSAILKQIQ